MQKFFRCLDFILPNNLIMATLFVLIGITLSLNLRYEIIIDLYNYHYLVPWAFLHHRTFTDIALAAENTYHNPLIDIPIYLLVKYFNNLTTGALFFLELLPIANDQEPFAEALMTSFG